MPCDPRPLAEGIIAVPLVRRCSRGGGGFQTTQADLGGFSAPDWGGVFLPRYLSQDQSWRELTLPRPVIRNNKRDGAYVDCGRLVECSLFLGGVGGQDRMYPAGASQSAQFSPTNFVGLPVRNKPNRTSSELEGPRSPLPGTDLFLFFFSLLFLLARLLSWVQACVCVFPGFSGSGGILHNAPIE